MKNSITRGARAKIIPFENRYWNDAQFQTLVDSIVACFDASGLPMHLLKEAATLAEIHLENEKRKKPLPRDAGLTVLETMLFLTVFAAIMTAVVTLASMRQQIIDNFNLVERCLRALLECTL